mmetsp:Transcript_39337/g.125480  ORF Transcript_39337/g.125480 Transcript_39337/m.125480 type:complete len:229 (-) Transcript_39337:1342-2028(-)
MVAILILHPRQGVPWGVKAVIFDTSSNPVGSTVAATSYGASSARVINTREERPPGGIDTPVDTSPPPLSVTSTDSTSEGSTNVVTGSASSSSTNDTCVHRAGSDFGSSPNAESSESTSRQMSAVWVPVCKSSCTLERSNDCHSSHGPPLPPKVTAAGDTTRPCADAPPAPVSARVMVTLPSIGREVRRTSSAVGTRPSYSVIDAGRHSSAGTSLSFTSTSTVVLPNAP